MSKILYVDLEYRDNLGQWLNERGLTGAMAEIGVMYGGYADIVLKKWKGQRYYMVDLWARQDKSVYRERTDDINYESCYQQCCRMAAADPRIQILRKTSVEAAREVPDESLDCVFIDANHAYDAVLADLNAWWPKVRPGGVFAGHDYGNDINYPNYCEVKRAVDPWMIARGLTFVYSRCNSWWTSKPVPEP